MKYTIFDVVATMIVLTISRTKVEPRIAFHIMTDTFVHVLDKITTSKM